MTQGRTSMRRSGPSPHYRGETRKIVHAILRHQDHVLPIRYASAC